MSSVSIRNTGSMSWWDWESQKSFKEEGDSSKCRRTGHSRHGHNWQWGVIGGCAWGSQQTQLPGLAGVRPAGEIAWPDRQEIFVLKTPFPHKTVMSLTIYLLSFPYMWFHCQGRAWVFLWNSEESALCFWKIGLKWFKGHCEVLSLVSSSQVANPW